MSEYKKMFKVFLAGQEDAETTWLSQMSREGYHLTNINFGVHYVFKKGEKAKYTYYIDYKENNNIDEEYKMMYSDVGLDYIDNSNGYYYFRCEEGSDTLAIINNEQGRYMGRLGVQKKVLMIVGFMNLMIFGVNLLQFFGQNYSYEWTVYLNLLCSILCLGLAFKVNFKIKDLKKSGVKEPYKSKIKDFNSFYIIVTICLVLIVLYSIISFFDIFMF